MRGMGLGVSKFGIEQVGGQARTDALTGPPSMGREGERKTSHRNTETLLLAYRVPRVAHVHHHRFALSSLFDCHVIHIEQ
jgi:hypothetical protein